MILPNRAWAACVAMLLVACVAWLGACHAEPTRGYSFASTIGGSSRTISVDILDNYTFSKGAETELTEAVIKELQRATTLRVTRDHADTSLTGVVRGVDMKRVARDSASGLTDQLSIKVTVDFEWKDNRTGAVLLGRRNFSAVDVFVPGQGTGEPIELGRRLATQRLAADLVAELRSTW
jgi:hypothetical protein